jgi:hypothetical protein
MDDFSILPGLFNWHVLLECHVHLHRGRIQNMQAVARQFFLLFGALMCISVLMSLANLNLSSYLVKPATCKGLISGGTFTPALSIPAWRWLPDGCDLKKFSRR